MAVVAWLPVGDAQAADCGDAATQMAMNQCAAGRLAAADAALNAAYGQVIGRLRGTDGEKLLRGAQRAWLGFRDQHCAFMASGVAGGSIEPFIRDGCMQELTEARTQQLDLLLHCEEGDLSCSVPPG
jgi:uncharacterized protein YecT (DUF1311 family)